MPPFMQTAKRVGRVVSIYATKGRDGQAEESGESFAIAEKRGSGRVGRVVSVFLCCLGRAIHGIEGRVKEESPDSSCVSRVLTTRISTLIRESRESQTIAASRVIPCVYPRVRVAGAGVITHKAAVLGLSRLSLFGAQLFEIITGRVNGESNDSSVTLPDPLRCIKSATMHKAERLEAGTL